MRLLLCGSAMSVMGGLLSGPAPLRGRAGLELIVHPFGYRDAARFWEIADPKLAVLVHSVVGGTPAYRRELLREDAPADLAGFDPWVIRTVLNAQTPLFREARYLLAEETEIRDPSLYHSVLAAVAEGNTTSGGIASSIGRKSNEIAHPLRVLEDSRDLLAVKGFDTRDTVLTCYSGAGFDRELQAGQRHDIRLAGLDQLYADEGPSSH